ncbi:class I SAM-dependent methyltransferase [archaeon]|nr:class I SAM-dependent methyltransferase [archaeon]
MELSRTLDELDFYLNDFTKRFEKKLLFSKKINVLDAGCGNGLVMLGLSKRFGNKIKLVGYNQKKEHGNFNSMKLKGIKKSIISDNEFKQVKNNISFTYFDVDKKFLFKKNSFDFIYSLASIYLYQDKIKFLENCNNILKDKGVARIQLFEIKNSDKNISKEILGKPMEYNAFIEIWDDGKLISIKDYFKQFKGVNIGFGKKENGNKIVYVEIIKQKKLDFGLEFLYAIDSHKIYDSWMGVKSIYKVKK